MKLHEVQEHCALALMGLESLFKPHVKLTLLMRNPQVADGDLIVTVDDLGEVIKSIERLREQEQAAGNTTSTNAAKAMEIVRKQQTGQKG